MVWGQIAGAAIGALGGALTSGGSPNQYGGGMDYFNKVARAPMQGTLDWASQIYNPQNAVNPLMQQGFDMMSQLPQSLQQYLGYGNQMLGTGQQAMQGQMAGAGAMLGFDPTKYNAQFQAGGAVGPQYGQGTYNQVMGNAQGAIDPMLQSIAQMNSRTFNEQQMPGMAANAIGSGQTASSKWGLNNAVLMRGVADANSQAANNLYGNAFQQASQIAGQYGLSQADAINAALRQNTQLSNQLNYQQAGNNMQARLQALQGGTGAYGNMVSQTSPYWQGMTELTANMPQWLAQMGMMQRNAPADWLNQYQGAISNVGTAGAPSGGSPAGAGSNIMDGIGRGMGAGLQLGSLFGGQPNPNAWKTGDYGNLERAQQSSDFDWNSWMDF